MGHQVFVLGLIGNDDLAAENTVGAGDVSHLFFAAGQPDQAGMKLGNEGFKDFRFIALGVDGNEKRLHLRRLFPQKVEGR